MRSVLSKATKRGARVLLESNFLALSSHSDIIQPFHVILTTITGEETDSGDSFVYLGGAGCVDGKTEREVRRRVQAGANVWRAVEGVMADWWISKRLKGKIMSISVTQACLYGRKPWQ